MVHALVDGENKIRVKGHAPVGLVKDLVRRPEDDAETGPGASERPEEIRVGRFGRGDEAAVRGYDDGGDEGVDYETVETLEATDAAADGCAYYAGAGAGAGYFGVVRDVTYNSLEEGGVGGLTHLLSGIPDGLENITKDVCAADGDGVGFGVDVDLFKGA